MKRILWCAVCAISLGATSALSQDYQGDDPDERAEQAARDAREAADRADRAVKDRPNRLGLELQVGGGVQDFVDRDVTAVTNTGGAWTARLIVGTRSHIAGEAAYVGSAQGLNTLGVEDSATLLSNGLEGALRLNILTGAVQPYAVAGYTWRRYTVTNTAVNFSSVADAANVSEIPLGVGLAFRFSRLVADLRATARPAFASSLFPQGNLTTFGGEAKLGFEF